METEEIAILCKDDALFSTGSRHRCAEEARFSHCFDINASFA